MEIRLEKLRREHINTLAEIEKECFSTPWSENALEAETVNPLARFFVAVADGKTVGYAGMHIICGECYITNIAVTGDYRRRGIATLLLKRLEETAKNEKADFITLEVRKSNSDAIDLYTKHGYKQTGVRKGFYTKPTEDAVLMTKTEAEL